MVFSGYARFIIIHDGVNCLSFDEAVITCKLEVYPTVISLLSDTPTNFGVRKSICSRWAVFLIISFLKHVVKSLAKKISL